MKDDNARVTPQDLPLVLNERTYNTQHPDFRVWMTNNYPGKIYTHSAAERLLLNFPDNIKWDAWRRLVTRTRLKYFEIGALYVLDRLLSRPPRNVTNRLYQRLLPHARLRRSSRGESRRAYAR